METYRIDTDTEHGTVVQTWTVTFRDRPCMIVYDQKLALGKFWAADAVEITSQAVMRHDNGDRTYYGAGTVASAVADMLHADETAVLNMCRYYVLCANEASGTAEHLFLGAVPTCERCATKHDLALTPFA